MTIENIIEVETLRLLAKREMTNKSKSSVVKLNGELTLHSVTLFTAPTATSGLGAYQAEACYKFIRT